MSKEYFIAKKIHDGESEDKKVSRPIIRISKISIVLAMIVNIVTIAVVTGFQNQVKDKVTGFGANISIIKAGEQSAFESAPLKEDTNLLANVSKIDGVTKIQKYAYKPALLQSSPDTISYHLKGVDTFQVQQEIQGVVIKGVTQEYDWSFFKKHLIEGRIPKLDSSIQDEVMLSTSVAKDLNLSIGDRVSTFYVKNQPIKKYNTVVGLFETGLEEFDKQIVVGDLREVQALNDWGVKAAVRVADTMTNDGQFIIYGDVTGGNGNYRYDWGEGYENMRGFTFCGTKDTTIRLIASDYWMFVEGDEDENAIPDTAYLKISISGNKYLPCYPKNMDGKYIEREYLNDDGTKFAITIKGGKKYTFEYIDGKGSHHNYIGGYEVFINDFSKLDEISRSIKKSILFQDENQRQDYHVKTIQEDQREIFLWLSFLDLNVIIILILMILVSTINMGSGLLVLIITKTNLIGLLKAIGATNWTIRKIFLHQAVFIIFKGMIWGNIIGIGLCLLQQYYVLIPLNPEVYYLNAVPIELNWMHIVLLNLGTLLLCVAMLVIPSYVVTKISPIKALKFD